MNPKKVMHSVKIQRPNVIPYTLGYASKVKLQTRKMTITIVDVYTIAWVSLASFTILTSIFRVRIAKTMATTCIVNFTVALKAATT